MSVGGLRMANRGLVLNNKYSACSLFRFQQLDNIHRRSLAAIR